MRVRVSREKGKRDGWGRGQEQGACWTSSLLVVGGGVRGDREGGGVGWGKVGRKGKGVGKRGWDSYSRAEGPPAIIFKPLQPTLELVEIKH